MLESLHIENIALIKKLDISLSPAFSAFTGETGAGKSIIIDSIGVLCGNKAPRELIRNGESKALVEGMFSSLSKHALEKCASLGIEPDEDGILHISRTINLDAKSTVRINGRAVPNSTLKEISSSLINIHGQHDNTELLNKESHRKLVDEFGGLENELKEYSEVFTEYCNLKRELEAKSMDESEKIRRIEMLKFQVNDISSLKLKEGEEEKLTEEKKRVLNIEKLAKNCNIASGSLYGSQGGSASDCIDNAVEALRVLSKISPEYEDYIDTLTEIKSTLYDISERIADSAGETVDNPDAVLDKIESRLDAIAKAKRKYGFDITEVLSYLDKAKKELDDLENFDRSTDKIKDALNICGTKLKECGSKLTAKRTKIGETLKKNVEEQLKFLDMPGVKFRVSITEKPYSKDGADDIEFFIMTNSGEGYSPLSKTASGGELSRIMLAIKSVIAEKDGVDTLIFDEVDTGISGKTSRKIGLKLDEISSVSQVLCVTHSAQICSLAKDHFLVSKKESSGRTVTDVKLLSDIDRINETARIIAGINITDSSVTAAKELIESKTL